MYFMPWRPEWRPDPEQLDDATFYESWLLVIAAGVQYVVGNWLRWRAAGKGSGE